LQTTNVIGKFVMVQHVNLEMRMERTKVLFWSIQGAGASRIYVRIWEIYCGQWKNKPKQKFKSKALRIGKHQVQELETLSGLLVIKGCTGRNRMQETCCYTYLHL
jgi:hypothetical protein